MFNLLSFWILTGYNSLICNTWAVLILLEIREHERGRSGDPKFRARRALGQSQGIPICKTAQPVNKAPSPKENMTVLRWDFKGCIPILRTVAQPLITQWVSTMYYQTKRYCPTTRRWSMYFPIRRILPVRLEPGKTLWEDSTTTLGMVSQAMDRRT